MSITHLVPYEILDSDTWTVNSLLMNINVKLDNRICLKDLVEFNKRKLTDAHIDKNMSYKYLEISSIEAGLITKYKELQGDELPSRARLVARKGDVILSTIRPERGAVAIVPEELDGCVVTNGFAVMSPNKVSSEVLYFLFRSQKIHEELGHLVKGTTTPMVSLKQLKEYTIPIGSLEEKDKEYAKVLYRKWLDANQMSELLQETVERVFSRNLRSDLNQITIDRKVKYTVLPYCQLEDRLDVDYYMPRSSTDLEWTVPVRTLGDVVSKFVLGASVSLEEYCQGSIECLSYIRIKDIDDNKVNVPIGDFANIAENQGLRYANHQAYANDIVIARVGGTLGKSALVQERLAGSIVSQHLVILRCSDLILPEFLLYFLKTSWAREQLNARAAGSGQQFIKMEELKEVVVPLPYLKQQLKIVQQINCDQGKNDLSFVNVEVLSFVKSLVGK